ncbi:lysozyme inhibitor LprI family protein [Consotaella aegiceratis]|uniref:lysozyme inhibitor LprI family protein n=1 Tax=Consotaella aegiceratis TaxID=3097961 RepID=UPI002F3F2BCD
MLRSFGHGALGVVTLACVLTGGGWTAPATAAAQECGAQANQLELTACANEAFAEADDRLNRTYRSIVGRLDGDAPRLESLRKAQRAWIAFRDAECVFATSGTVGGSAHPMIDADCRRRLTLQRAEALETYLHCQEGDLSCSVPLR